MVLITYMPSSVISLMRGSDCVKVLLSITSGEDLTFRVTIKRNF